MDLSNDGESNLALACLEYLLEQLPTLERSSKWGGRTHIMHQSTQLAHLVDVLAVDFDVVDRGLKDGWH
jgi:hypothetical protein